jgi:hypothetical protein
MNRVHKISVQKNINRYLIMSGIAVAGRRSPIVFLINLIGIVRSGRDNKTYIGWQPKPEGVELRRTILFMAALALMLTNLGCDEKLSSVTGPTPDLEPTFSSIQRNIFQTTDLAGRAACTNCHTTQGGRVPPVGMDLGSPTAHSQLVNVPAVGKAGAIRVIPGDPENSYLIHKLDGRPGIAGLRMPRTAPYLTDGQILVIKRWIQLGAANN